MTGNAQLADALRRYAAVLEIDRPVSYLRSAYDEILAPVVGDTLRPSIEADGWVVVKHYGPSFGGGGRTAAWPNQAYEDRDVAERWREFVEDYYYDVQVRDGTERWTVERRTVGLHNFHDPDRPIGDGYYGRSGWVGTLPMRVYEPDGHGRWRRIAS